jgi:hypothetical protein
MSSSGDDPQNPGAPRGDGREKADPRRGDHPENHGVPPTPGVADFTLEAALLGLVKDDNPWEFLAQVRATIEAKERHRAYEHFLLLCAGRSRAERDALGVAGREIFKYRIETFRDDLNRLTAAGAAPVRVVPCITIGGACLEMIYRPDERPRIGFAVYRDGAVDFAERVKIAGTTFIPPQSKLVEANTILLPSGVEEYGDDHALSRDIRTFIEDHVLIEDPTFRDLMTYYVLLSWVYDCFSVLPYLRAQGDFGSGKTRLLQVMGALCYRGIWAGGATTPAPLFRILEAYHGTLVLDEADFEVSDAYAEIIKLLNQGHQRGFPVLRAEKTKDGSEFDVRAYDTFGPKILATRRRFKDQALESRCLTYAMGSAPVPRGMKLSLDEEFFTAARTLRNKLLLWRFRNHGHIGLDPTLRFDHVEPRMNQIIQPLLSCTRDARMRTEILALVERFQRRQEEERRESLEGLVATALVTLYVRERAHREYILTKTLTEQVNADNDLTLEPRKVSDIVRASSTTAGIPRCTRDLRTSNGCPRATGCVGWSRGPRTRRSGR